MLPMPSPVLIFRNNGPAFRRATACQASNARTGQVSTNLPRGRPISAPLPVLVGFAAAQPQPQPAGDDRDIFHIEGHEFGAAQCAGKPEQQQGAVAPAARAGIARRQQLAEHGERQCGGFSHRAAVGPEHAPQRALDVAMGGVPRQIVEPVHFSERGEPPADGGGGVGFGQAGEVGADDFWRGRNGDKSVRGAPCRKMGPVGLVGAQGCRCRGLPGEHPGRGERGLAGRRRRQGNGRGRGWAGGWRQNLARHGDRLIRQHFGHDPENRRVRTG